MQRLGKTHVMAAALLAAGIAAAHAHVGPTAAKGLLVVLNKSDHEAALVDPATFQVITKLPTGRGPHEVAATSDGKLTYVSNYGLFNVFQPGEKPRMEPGNTITVLDLFNRKVKATFDLRTFRQPHGIWVSRDGRRVWVTCESAQSVLELNGDAGTVLRAWKTAQQVSHMVVPTPDERKLYVSNIGSGSVSVIDRSALAGADPVPAIPTGTGAEGIAVTPDGREVWVTNRGADTLSVIDTASDKVVAGFDSGGKMPIRVKFTPDGKQAWVSNAQSNRISVFDVAARKLLGTIEVGAVPVGLQMTPDGARVFVAATNANQVFVVDVAARKVLSKFSTGIEPDGMAWANQP